MQMFRLCSLGCEKRKRKLHNGMQRPVQLARWAIVCEEQVNTIIIMGLVLSAGRKTDP